MNDNMFLQAGQPFDPQYTLGESSLKASELKQILKQRDSTDIFIADEIPEEGIEAAELKDRVGLTYSAMARRLFEMYEAGLLSRIRATDSINPKSQPYLYFRAQGLNRGIIAEIAREKRLDLGKIKEEFQRKSLRLREKQEPPHPLSQEAEDVEIEPHALILGRLIQEIRTIKEENAFLKQEVAELKSRLIELEKPSTRSSNNEEIMAMLNQLLSPNQIKNGRMSQ